MEKGPFSLSQCMVLMISHLERILGGAIEYFWINLFEMVGGFNAIMIIFMKMT